MSTLDIIKMDNFTSISNNVYDTVPLTTSKKVHDFLTDEEGVKLKQHKNIMRAIKRGILTGTEFERVDLTPYILLVCIESTYKAVR